MANVSFKRGLQSNLDQLTSYIDGAFYLTTDTDRLYFAQSENELVHLNHNVIHVGSVSALPKFSDAAVGDFYYAEEENVLCTKRNGETQWTQINRNTDTNLDTYLIADGTEFVSSLDGQDIKVEYKLHQVTKDHLQNSTTDAGSITGSFKINATDIVGAANVQVDTQASVNGNVIHIQNEGPGSLVGDEKGFDLAVSGSLSVSTAEDGTITIDGVDTKYRLESAANSDNAVISLFDDKTSTNVNFEAGKDLVVDGSAENVIKYSHSTIETNSEEGSQSLTYNGSFDVIDTVTVDNGHITNYTTKTLTLPQESLYTFSDLKADDTGAISFVVTHNGTETATVNGEQSIYFKLSDDENAPVIYNQGNLNVYTRAEVDAKLKGVDAMRFMGVLNEADSLPTNNVSNGDTYKVGTIGTHAGVVAEVGDLFIATGEEDPETGFIAADEIVWSYIPAGDDFDSQYAISAANNAVVLTNTNGGNQVSGTVTFDNSDSKINIQTLNNNTIRINHATVDENVEQTDNAQLTASGELLAISDIDVDETGHITSYTLKTYTLPEDKNTTYTVEVNTEGKSLVLNGGTSNTAVSFVEGKQVTIDAAENQFTFNHADITTTPATAASAISANRTFNAINAITTDNGHITGYTVETYTLPDDKDTTYSIENTFADHESANVKDGITLTSVLVGTNGETSSEQFVIKSNSLNISGATKTETNPHMISVELEWGSF